MEQLVYTSAPQGLQQGSSGFCTVEMTEGMPPDMMDSLEALSAYDNDPSQTVNWMHLRFNSVRGMRHVFSRVGPLKGEFSGRTNKLAHHICLPPSELPPQGPMRIVGLGGPLQQHWSGEVRYLSAQGQVTNLRVASMPRPCRVWESAVGDAGVAGAVLSKLCNSDSSPLWIVRTPQMDALAMTDEILGLLSGPERWEVTFCTYLHALPRSVECRLRWVLPDSPAMSHLQNLGPDQLIDLRSGAEPILRGADLQMIDAARTGKAVVGATALSPVVARSTEMSSDALSSVAMSAEISIVAPPRRGVSKVDLQPITPSGDMAETLPPPPPSQQASLLRWVLLGVGIGSILAFLLLFFLISGDPKPVAVMHETQTEQRQKPPIEPPIETELQVEPPIETELQVEPALQAKEEAKPLPEEKNRKPWPTKKKEESLSKVERGPEIKSEIPRDLKVPLRMPIAGAFSTDVQSIHSGAGVREITMMEIPVERSFTFEMTEPDYAGVRDLKAVATTGQERKLGTITTESDRVLFAWAANANRTLAAKFVLTNSFLIKDETHHNTIHFLFADPDTLELPPTPVAKGFDVVVPSWIDTNLELLLKPTLYSVTPEATIAFDRFAIAARAEAKSLEHRIDLRPLHDPQLLGARFVVRAFLAGSGGDRNIRFSSNLYLGNGDNQFEWLKRRSVIRDQTAKHNEAQRNKNPAERKLMSAATRLEAIEQWGQGLRCQLELYARVGDRVVLCGKTSTDDPAEADTSGGASR